MFYSGPNCRDIDRKTVCFEDILSNDNPLMSMVAPKLSVIWAIMLPLNDGGIWNFYASENM